MAPWDVSGQARHLSKKCVGWGRNLAGSALFWLVDSILLVPYRLPRLSGLDKRPCAQPHQRMAKWQTGSRAGDPCQRSRLKPAGAAVQGRASSSTPKLSQGTLLHHSLAPAPSHNPCSTGCHRPSHKAKQGFCGKVPMNLKMLSHWYSLLKSWTVWCEYS